MGRDRASYASAPSRGADPSASPLSRHPSPPRAFASPLSDGPKRQWAGKQRQFIVRRPTSSTVRQIPKGVWVLGFVSMLMDISSEMIHSLLPMFMVTSLGTSVLAVGFVEGLAESTALIVKVFSGSLSDYLGKRKGLAVAGYALGAV